MVTYLYRRFYKNIVDVQNKLRILHLKLLGAELGKNIRVFGRFVQVGDAQNLSIGEGSTINEGVFLNTRDKIVIGKHVHLSPYVQLQTGGLVVHLGEKEHERSPIVIEDHVWIAYGAVVLPGVTIGENAGVVRSSVPRATIVAGVPAREIRKISS
jgi:acetyltransferase-like isoleucine patch superfamily enzyme